MIADRHVQVSTSCQFLFAVHLGDGRAQLVVGLNAIFRAVDVTLQLWVAQVAKRVNAADQLIKFKNGLARAVMPVSSSLPP